jgi:glycosyltransferase involved in cell wall biosynthesis
MTAEAHLTLVGQACDISVIIPVLDREDGAEAVWRAYNQELVASGRSFEFIYVLDGPHESYADTLERLAQNGGPIRIVRLNRSFGEAACLQEGIKHARADILLMLPAYLQVKPESIPLILAECALFDVVAGARDRRRDTHMSRWRGWWFRRLAHMAGSKFDDPGCNVRAVHRRVFDELQLQSDQQFFLPFLAQRLGFTVQQVVLPQADMDRGFRPYRPTDYVSRFMDIVALWFLVRFMHQPFRFFGTIGAVLASLGMVVGIYVVAQRELLDVRIADRPALLLSVLLVVLGIQVGAVGLIAEIVMFTRYRSMPAYRIDRIVARIDDE